MEPEEQDVFELTAGDEPVISIEDMTAEPIEEEPVLEAEADPLDPVVEETEPQPQIPPVAEEAMPDDFEFPAEPVYTEADPEFWIEQGLDADVAAALADVAQTRLDMDLVEIAPGLSVHEGALPKLDGETFEQLLAASEGQGPGTWWYSGYGWGFEPQPVEDCVFL